MSVLRRYRKSENSIHGGVSMNSKKLRIVVSHLMVVILVAITIVSDVLPVYAKPLINSLEDELIVSSDFDTYTMNSDNPVDEVLDEDNNLKPLTDEILMEEEGVNGITTLSEYDEDPQNAISEKSIHAETGMSVASIKMGNTVRFYDDFDAAVTAWQEEGSGSTLKLLSDVRTERSIHVNGGTENDPMVCR